MACAEFKTFISKTATSWIYRSVSEVNWNIIITYADIFPLELSICLYPIRKKKNKFIKYAMVWIDLSSCGVVKEKWDKTHTHEQAVKRHCSLYIYINQQNAKR